MMRGREGRVLSKSILESQKTIDTVFEHVENLFLFVFYSSSSSPSPPPFGLKSFTGLVIDQNRSNLASSFRLMADWIYRVFQEWTIILRGGTSDVVHVRYDGCSPICRFIAAVLKI